MLPYLVGILVCLGMLAGCGGGHQGNLIQTPTAAPDTEVAAAPVEEETLAEELSAKRLEELYAKSGIPGWDVGLEEELKKWEHQVKFDVPIEMNKQVRAYLVYFSTERKDTIRRYLSRSTRYLPMIKDTFQEYGLPDDLAYLAMIESGFVNKAASHAGAVGMWQFIRGTGVRYGLVIDGYVDERRDPEKATRAAARYLLDLYKQFGSWYLAAASYNCGEGRVQRELNQSSHKNFWELSANMCLPSETKNYVPQMIAATIIAKNPEKFGFRSVPYLPAMSCEHVEVKEPVSLRAVSYAVNVPLDDVQALNPELLRGVTPPDASKYALKIPAKTGDLFAKNIELACIEYPAVASRPAYTGKSGKYASKSRSSTRVASSSRKADKKTKTLAKAETSANGKKGKAASNKPGVSSSPKLASIFGSPAAIASKSQTNGQKKATPVASRDYKAKGKTQAQKKSGSAKVAKKTDAGKNSKTKTSQKNGASNSRSKDKEKVSKNGSRQALAANRKPLL